MWILAKILCEITGVPRYKPEIVWSYFWTHNIFRAYEAIFWRRFGIRAEMTSSRSEDGVVEYRCHSWESVFALSEYMIRRYLRGLVPKNIRVTIPMLKTPSGFDIPASPFLFAIAYDSSGDGGYSGGGEHSPFSWSHTCTGSNLILVAWTGINMDTDPITGVTYNSVSMTRVTNVVLTGRGNHYAHILAGPSTGANNITATGTGANGFYTLSTSYSGCSQTGQPDNFGSGTAGSGTSDSVSVTSVADNCWHIGVFRGGSGSTTAGSGTTSRDQNSTVTEMMACDSNAAKTPAGSYTLNASCTGADTWAHIGMTLAPTGGGGGSAPVVHSTLALLNAG